MPDPIRVDIDTKGNVKVIKPDGDIRVGAVLSLRSTFESIEKEESQFVVIDLSAMNYIDSSGIGLLLNFAKRLRTQDKRLYLFAPSQEMKAIFYIAELGDVIPFFDTYAEVLDAISGIDDEM